MLGEYLRKLRGERTQQEVVDALGHVRGVTQSTISRLEAGEWTPDTGQMEHILVALGATDKESKMARLLASAAAVRSA